MTTLAEALQSMKNVDLRTISTRGAADVGAVLEKAVGEIVEREALVSEREALVSQREANVTLKEETVADKLLALGSVERTRAALTILPKREGGRRWLSRR